jgi:hypothetical protein
MHKLFFAIAVLGASYAHAVQNFSVTGVHRAKTCSMDYAKQDAVQRAAYACSGRAVRVSKWQTTWDTSVDPCIPTDPVNGGTCSPEYVTDCYATAVFRCK